MEDTLMIKKEKVVDLLFTSFFMTMTAAAIHCCRPPIPKKRVLLKQETGVSAGYPIPIHREVLAQLLQSLPLLNPEVHLQRQERVLETTLRPQA